jgi:hypothetical protein
MKHKSGVNSEFKSWKVWAEKHFDLKVGACRNDNGGEFTNNMLTALHQAAGGTIEPTAPYNPKQNGVAERSLIDANLPEHCYGDVSENSVHPDKLIIIRRLQTTMRLLTDCLRNTPR